MDVLHILWKMVTSLVSEVINFLIKYVTDAKNCDMCPSVFISARVAFFFDPGGSSMTSFCYSAVLHEVNSIVKMVYFFIGFTNVSCAY
jgi:hypothetical protein